MHGVHLLSRLLQLLDHDNRVCGYGGIVHNVHCGQFLRRGCRGACCVQLQLRVLFVCWCRYHMYRHCRKLCGMRCRKFLCRRRRCASRMHV